MTKGLILCVKIKPRLGCKDVWNAFMCKDTIYGPNDIPYCPTTATTILNDIITWTEAKSIYKKYSKKTKIFLLMPLFVGILMTINLMVLKVFGTIIKKP